MLERAPAIAAAAAEILAMINSRPQSPRQGEIETIIAGALEPGEAPGIVAPAALLTWHPLVLDVIAAVEEYDRACSGGGENDDPDEALVDAASERINEVARCVSTLSPELSYSNAGPAVSTTSPVSWRISIRRLSKTRSVPHIATGAPRHICSTRFAKSAAVEDTRKRWRVTAKLTSPSARLALSSRVVLGTALGGALGLATSGTAQSLFGEHFLLTWGVRHKGAVVCMDPTIFICSGAKEEHGRHARP
jgi:hypothetical protein